MLDFDGSTAYNGETPTVTAYPFTLAAWAVSPSSAFSAPSIFRIGDVHDTNHYGEAKIEFYPADVDLWNVRAAARDYSFSPLRYAISATSVGASVLTHVAGVFISNASRKIYLNGGGEGTNTQTADPHEEDFVEVTLGYSGSGVLAESPAGHFAVWAAELTAAEIALLATGVHPMLVRPSALRFYDPGDYADHHSDWISGGVLIKAGSAGVATVGAPLMGYGRRLPVLVPTAGGSTIDLAGAIVASADAAGMLDLELALSGDASSSAALQGALGVRRGIAGAAVASAELAGAMALELTLSGDAAGVATLVGNLGASGQVILAGAAVASAELAGAMALELTLSGDASSSAALQGALGVRRGIAGAAVASAALAGELSITGHVDLAGAAVASAALAGALDLDVALSGDAAGVGIAQGRLSVSGQIDLIGVAVASAALAGELTVTAPTMLKATEPTILSRTARRTLASHTPIRSLDRH